jgi:hypothetical protein
MGIYHDLSNGAYLTGGYDNELKDTIQFGVRGRLGEFQPDSLRRLGGTL